MKGLRTRVKFCGITSVDDALAAAALGVDAVGIVLARGTRRCITLDHAREIRMALPPFVTLVALFLDDDADYVDRAIDSVHPQLLQFHGTETSDACERSGLGYVKSVAMGGARVDWKSLVEAHPKASGFVFDGNAVGAPGGTGESFDWSTLPSKLGKPLILAGGLTAENVSAAVRAVRPYAVDVSSGIESSVGIKDAHKMRRFIDQVHAV